MSRSQKTCLLAAVGTSTTHLVQNSARNNGDNHSSQAKDASRSRSTKELRQLKAKAKGVSSSWGQSYALGFRLGKGRTVLGKRGKLNPRYVSTFQGVEKVVPLGGLQVDENLHFVEEPVEIMDREVKQLRRSRVPIVKVRWNSRRGPEFTWEREDQFRKKYPHLFTKTAPSTSAMS
ncbi:hypothetical protein Tco_1263977 [Tanacetum coccineum]